MDSFIGQVRLTACNSVDPNYWLPCDGRLLRIQENKTLYSLLGNTYGGDDSTTFALPDLRDRFVLGVGTSRSAELPAASYTDGQQGGVSAYTPASLDPYAAPGTAPAAITLTDPPFKTTTVLAGTKLSVNNVGAGPLISSNIGVATVEGNSLSALAAGTAIIVSAALTGGANLTVVLPPISVLPATAPQNLALASLGLIYVICVNGTYPLRGN